MGSGNVRNFILSEKCLNEKLSELRERCRNLRSLTLEELPKVAGMKVIRVVTARYSTRRQRGRFLQRHLTYDVPRS